MAEQRAPLNSKELIDPTSEARATFVGNSADIRAYFVLHQLAFKDANKAVRRLAYVVDKSIYILVASLWEAYCEDVVTESLNHIIAYAPSYHSLQQGLIEEIQKTIRSGKDSPWDLAGEGWREYLKKRREGFERKRNKEFAGPKSESVEQFFSHVLGIDELCNSWKTAAGAPLICEELDEHIDRRNTLVHRITPGRVLNKRDVKQFYKVVWRLVEYTDAVIDEMLVGTTGESRWKSRVIIDDIDGNESVI